MGRITRVFFVLVSVWSSIGISRGQEQPTHEQLQAILGGAAAIHVLQNNNYYALQQKQFSKIQKKKSMEFLFETNIIPYLLIRYHVFSEYTEVTTRLLRENNQWIIRLTGASFATSDIIVNEAIDSPYYTETKIIRMNPFDYHLPGLDVTISAEYPESIETGDGILELRGMVNAEALQLKYQYRAGVLRECVGKLGSAVIKITYAGFSDEKPSSLVESAQLTFTYAKGSVNYSSKYYLDGENTSAYSSMVTQLKQ